MQLFVDIDGVLLNFEQAFVSWLNGTYALGLPESYEAENWDFTEVMDRNALREGWPRFLESEEAGRMQPLVDPDRFSTLAGHHTLHLVTNFPKPYFSKRLENLHAQGFFYHTLHYCGLQGFQGVRPVTKAQMIESLRRDGQSALFVDDHPDNCLNVLTHCPDVEVWLMSRRFNRGFHHPAIHRTEGWEPLFERLGHAPSPGGIAALTTTQFPALARHLGRSAVQKPSAAPGSSAPQVAPFRNETVSTAGERPFPGRKTVAQR